MPESATLLRFDLLLARESVLDRIGDRPAQQADLAVLDALEAVARRDRPGRRVRLLLDALPVGVPPQRVRRPGGGRPARRSSSPESAGLDDLETEARLWLGKGLTWEGQHEAAREALDAAAGRRPRARANGG